jgi:hypothetical protein
MKNQNRISIIEEYQTAKEEKEELETELYNFQLSIGSREATYDELKQEVEYRKKISNKQYELDCLKEDIKIVMSIRTVIAIIGLAAAALIIAISTKCAKDKNEVENKNSYLNQAIVIEEENCQEEGKILNKTLR